MRPDRGTSPVPDPTPARTREEALESGWLVWSNEHGAWWRADRSGYTGSITEAGRYTFDEAVRSMGPKVRPEAMVPSPEMLAALARLAEPEEAKP